MVGFKKYKAMFQFDARNTDELSLKVGDIVLVSVSKKYKGSEK